MNKKKIFGIVLFIVIGLFMFTFANPNEELEEGNVENNLTINEEKQDKEKKPKNNQEDNELTVDITNTEETVPAFAPAQVVQQVSIEELRNQAKTEVSNYANSLELEDTEKMQEIVNEANTLIDNANSKNELDRIVEDTKNKLDEVKTLENLENSKEAALEEVKEYKNDYDFIDEDKYSELVNDASEKISAATTEEEVNEELEDFKKAIDELIELEDYKKNAIEELVLYKDSLELTKLIEEAEEVVDEAKTKINGASTKEEVDEIVDEAKELLDEIKTLIETVFEVKFIGLNDTLLGTSNVLYGEDAIAPIVENTTHNGITYEFSNWDLEYANVVENLTIKANYNIISVKANVMLDETLLNVVELNITDEILSIVNNNVDTIIDTNEETIKDYVNGELPKLAKKYYKYDFVSLNYDENGFSILANEVIDESQVVANVFVLNEGIERPSNSDRLSSSNYTKIGTVNLDVDKVKEYFNGKLAIVANDDVESFVKGNLPILDKEYYYYDFYVLKYETDGFHIDAEIVFDLEKYTVDKRNELNSLLEKDYTNYKETKTTDSYNALVSALENGKQASTIEEIEKAIEEIKLAETNLVDVVFVGLSLSSNNDIYYVNDAIKNITLTAVYNDIYRNYEITDYEVIGEFNTETVGNKSIVYSYNGIEIVYNYTVNYSLESLRRMADKISALAYISLKWDGFKYDGEEYSVGFNNLDGFEVRSIDKVRFGQVQRNINFTKDGEKLLISKDDYIELITNDPLFSREKIRVTYVINNQEVAVEYNAFLGIML